MRSKVFRVLVVSLAVSPAAYGGTTVEAVAKLTERIEAARSARVAGTVYVKSTSGVSVPCEWGVAFDGRGRFRETLAIVGCDDVKTYRYAVCDGERYMVVDEGTRVATVGKVMPLVRELRLRVLRGDTVPGMMGLTWGAAGFRERGREVVKGVEAEAMELKSASSPYRLGLWVDVKSGLPVRAAKFLALEGKAEELAQDWHTIVVDGAVEDDLFAVVPPTGYEVREKDQGGEDVRTGWSFRPLDQASGMRVDCRFAFEIGDRAVLLGWSAVDKEGKETEATRGVVPTLSRFDDDAAPAYRSRVVGRTKLANGRTLSWVVAVPATGDSGTEDRHRWVVMEGRKVGPTVVPLRLGREELGRLLREIPRVIGEAGETSMSLEEIEAASAKIREGRAS